MADARLGRCRRVRYLLDADTCVYLLMDSHPALTRRVALSASGDLAISTITFGEIAVGARAGKPPPADVLDAFVREIPLLPFDEAAARAYAGLPFKRARFDRLLAAHALSLDATIITNNLVDFADVPGLGVENWTLPS